jgi:hypothetical protein
LARNFHQVPRSRTNTNYQNETTFMRNLIRKSSSLLLAALPAVLLACGDSTAPGDTVVGNYTATSFTSTPTGGTARNEIQAGSTLTLNLNSNGTTSGHLHVAANGTNPVFDADMAGTWTATATTVDITQAADTFVRDMVFTIQRVGDSVTALVGDQVFVGGRVVVTLTRG